jgi:hypothetical protein
MNSQEVGFSEYVISTAGRNLIFLVWFIGKISRFARNDKLLGPPAKLSNLDEDLRASHSDRFAEGWSQTLYLGFDDCLPVTPTRLPKLLIFQRILATKKRVPLKGTWRDNCKQSHRSC